MSKIDDDIFKDAPPDEKEMQIDFTPPDEKGKTTKAKSHKANPDNKPIGSGKLVKGELKSNFRRLFNFLSKIFKSSTVFDDDDFNGLADDFIKLSARYSFINSVIDLLTPVFLVIDIIEKAIEIKNGQKAKEKTEQKAA